MSHNREALIKPLNAPNRLNLIERLDQILPQTQCQRCGYLACLPYAEAMARGEASPNRCPPGGQQGVKDLAAILAQAEPELELKRGPSGVGFIVSIDPAYCIGCTKCIRACPVDAIIGANKRMHSIIADQCTGCELCIPLCPTNCMALEPRAPMTWSADDAREARSRYQRRRARLAQDGCDVDPQNREASDQASVLAVKNPALVKQSALEKALEQARLRLATHAHGSPEQPAATHDEKTPAQKAGDANH